jgi:hypothetical protein
MPPEAFFLATAFEPDFMINSIGEKRVQLMQATLGRSAAQTE